MTTHQSQTAEHERTENMGDVHPIIYRPLKAEEIRLIALQSGKRSDESIECKMEYKTLGASGQDQEYDALSYTWGSPEEPRTISLDGKTCSVRKDLWWALYNLRSRKATRRVWIDALCINQANVSERNYQVGQMDRIYREARMVAISLGSPSVEDAHALDCFWKIYSELDDLPAGFGTCLQDSNGNEKWYRQFLHMWGYISKICAKTYWTRLWIIQEIVLGANLRLCFESNQMDCRIIHSVVYAASRIDLYGDLKDDQTQDQIKHSPLAKLLMHKKYTGTAWELAPLVELMHTFRHSGCTEPRDKVFGLLSLAEPCCREAISVDYAKSLPALCMEVLEHHFSCHDDVDFLLYGRTVQELLLKDQNDADAKLTKQLVEEVCSKNPKVFNVLGKAISVVDYTTPSLDSLTPDYFQEILDEKEELYLSTSLAGRIDQLSALRSKNGPTTEYVLNDLRDVQADTGTATSKTKPIDWFQPSLKEEHETSNLDRVKILQSLVQIIRDAEEKAKSTYTITKYKLFWTKSEWCTGHLALGPDTVQRGDLFCVIEGSGTDIIVRPDPSGVKFDVIGRSVPLVGDPFSHEKYHPRRLSSSHIHSITFGFDFSSMIHLTRPEGDGRDRTVPVIQPCAQCGT
jgi:hypothetical protein